MVLSIAVGVMTVSARRAHCERLVARIGGAVHVYTDELRLGCWHAWRSTWELCTSAELDASHVAILADDIAVCCDFRRTLECLAMARPHAAVSGWLPRDQVELAHARGLRWASTRTLQFVQCLLLPRELGESALAWIAEREPVCGDAWGPWDDDRLKAYAYAHALEVFVPVPNICDHLGGDGSIASMFGHRFAPESARARVWLGEHASGALLGWSDLDAIGDQPMHPYRVPRILLTPYNARNDEALP
jgi:hypothetical protein